LGDGQARYIVSSAPTVAAEVAEPTEPAEPPAPDEIELPPGYVPGDPSSHPLAIERLRAMPYPGSDLVVVQELSAGSNYRRAVATYVSEGLTIRGLLTIPERDRPRRHDHGRARDPHPPRGRHAARRARGLPRLRPAHAVAASNPWADDPNSADEVGESRRPARTCGEG
jgi:hypothetical protein